MSNWYVHPLKRYFSSMKSDRNIICVVFYSLKSPKTIHEQNVHLLPQYTLYNGVEQSNTLSALLLMESVKLPFLRSQNLMYTGFLDTNLTRTLPQWLLWGCMTASAFSLSVELLFFPHRPFNTSCTVPSTSNLSRILVIVTIVGGGGGSVPNSTLQCRWFSTFSNLQ